MLSRRNVRIKLMQVLYAAQRQELKAPRAFESLFLKMVDNTYKMYLQNLLILQRVAEYAKHDEATRRAKLRPTAVDKDFRPILATNRAVLSLSDNKELSQVYDRAGVRSMVDSDQVQNLYREFLLTPDYLNFLQTEGEPDDDSSVQLLLKLYKWLQSHELFISMIEDHFPLWGQDKSLVIGAMKKTIKAMPLDEDFYVSYSEHGEAVKEFGQPLLKFVVEADAVMLDRIKGVLVNWDADRVAIIDMILIKMAMGEFTQFPAIAPEVTINEYLDISKSYSTDKSREFINGVLDNLYKALAKEGLA